MSLNVRIENCVRRMKSLSLVVVVVLLQAPLMDHPPEWEDHLGLLLVVVVVVIRRLLPLLLLQCAQVLLMVSHTRLYTPSQLNRPVILGSKRAISSMSPARMVHGGTVLAMASLVLSQATMLREHKPPV